ncbi:SDR family NAD(P)-dependent oxidoreductase [Nocardioides bigeumensis]|uniref:SDR family NAD(P)-dependent oxidoreductase n=1 Tax=Nocardioides bigeumensis TaxID=433657 RepID=UPI0031DF77B7
MLVTGGAGVIGMAICRSLRDAGWTPVAGDLAPAIDSIDWDHPDNIDIRSVLLDVSDRQAVEASVADVLPEGLLLGGLVNCAGVLRDTFLGAVHEDHMRLMFEVNVAGTARVTDVYAPHLVDGGAIVNIGSLTGEIGSFVGASVYGATKAGLRAYTRYLAVELGARGIRVNNVAPGVIRAPMSPSMAAVSGGEEQCAERSILKRIGEPEEVASVVEFLLSSKSSFVTAQTLLVDGGLATP